MKEILKIEKMKENGFYFYNSNAYKTDFKNDKDKGKNLLDFNNNNNKRKRKGKRCYKDYKKKKVIGQMIKKKKYFLKLDYLNFLI